MVASREPPADAARRRFTPVKVDLRPSPGVRARRGLKWALIAIGVTLFVFGYLGALSGAMPHMQLHVPAQLVGLGLVVAGLVLRTHRR